MTFWFFRRHNQPLTVLCLNTPVHFATDLLSDLQQPETTGPVSISRLEEMIMKQVVLDYDRALWTITKHVRDIEKVSGFCVLVRCWDSCLVQKRSSTQPSFEELHELARHTLHSTESLDVAINTATHMIQQRSEDTMLYPSGMEKQKHEANLRFWCQVLQNLRDRSRSTDQRLKNEIQLVDLFFVIRLFSS